jgi:hypothetical protein
VSYANSFNPDSPSAITNGISPIKPVAQNGKSHEFVPIKDDEIVDEPPSIINGNDAADHAPPTAAAPESPVESPAAPATTPVVEPEDITAAADAEDEVEPQEESLDVSGMTPEKMVPMVLENLATQLGSLKLKPMERKQLKEISKSTDAISEKLASGSLEEEVVEKLGAIASGLAGQECDYKSALGLQVKLVDEYWSAHKSWLKGLKLLLMLSQTRKVAPKLSATKAEDEAVTQQEPSPMADASNGAWEEKLAKNLDDNTGIKENGKGMALRAAKLKEMPVIHRLQSTALNPEGEADEEEVEGEATEEVVPTDEAATEEVATEEVATEEQVATDETAAAEQVQEEQAPLPEGWEHRLDEGSGYYYYFNVHTFVSSWEHPDIVAAREAEEAAAAADGTADVPADGGDVGADGTDAAGAEDESAAISSPAPEETPGPVVAEEEVIAQEVAVPEEVVEEVVAAPEEVAEEVVEEEEEDESASFGATLSGLSPQECVQTVVTHYMELLEGKDVMLNGGEKRQLKELKKAKDLLFGVMEKEDGLEAEVMDKMVEMMQGLAAGETKLALKLHVELSDTHWKQHKNWLKGLKSLLMLVQARDLAPKKAPKSPKKAKAAANPFGAAAAAQKQAASKKEAPKSTPRAKGKKEKDAGPQSSPAGASPAGKKKLSKSEKEAMRKGLEAFYSEHDPSKNTEKNIKKIMKAFTQDEIVVKLEAKYGVAPTFNMPSPAPKTAPTVGTAFHSMPAAPATVGAPQMWNPGAGAGAGAAAAASDGMRNRHGNDQPQAAQFGGHPAFDNGGWQQDQQAGQPQLSNRDALIEFYTRKEPSKVGNVDTMLQRYSIPDLIEALMAKYGEAPALTEGDTGAASAAGVGGGPGMGGPGGPGAYDGGAQPAQPAQAAGQLSNRDLLAQFYTRMDPGKVNNVDQLLKSYSVDELKSALSAKYGEAPDLRNDAAPAAAPASGDAAPAKQLTNRQVLWEFYKQHQPDKLPMVDQLLAEYGGDASALSQLSQSLVNKYGVAPAFDLHENDICPCGMSMGMIALLVFLIIGCFVGVLGLAASSTCYAPNTISGDQMPCAPLGGPVPVSSKFGGAAPAGEGELEPSVGCWCQKLRADTTGVMSMGGLSRLLTGGVYYTGPLIMQYVSGNTTTGDGPMAAPAAEAKETRTVVVEMCRAGRGVDWRRDPASYTRLMREGGIKNQYRSCLPAEDPENSFMIREEFEVEIIPDPVPEEHVELVPPEQNDQEQHHDEHGEQHNEHHNEQQRQEEQQRQNEQHDLHHQQRQEQRQEHDLHHQDNNPHHQHNDPHHHGEQHNDQQQHGEQHDQSQHHGEPPPADAVPLDLFAQGDSVELDVDAHDRQQGIEHLMLAFWHPSRAGEIHRVQRVERVAVLTNCGGELDSAGGGRQTCHIERTNPDTQERQNTPCKLQHLRFALPVMPNAHGDHDDAEIVHMVDPMGGPVDSPVEYDEHGNAIPVDDAMGGPVDSPVVDRRGGGQLAGGGRNLVEEANEQAVEAAKLEPVPPVCITSGACASNMPYPEAGMHAMCRWVHTLSGRQPDCFSRCPGLERRKVDAWIGHNCPVRIPGGPDGDNVDGDNVNTSGDHFFDKGDNVQLDNDALANRIPMATWETFELVRVLSLCGRVLSTRGMGPLDKPSCQIERADGSVLTALAIHLRYPGADAGAGADGGPPPIEDPAAAQRRKEQEERNKRASENMKRMQANNAKREENKRKADEARTDAKRRQDEMAETMKKEQAEIEERRRQAKERKERVQKEKMAGGAQQGGPSISGSGVTQIAANQQVTANFRRSGTWKTGLLLEPCKKGDSSCPVNFPDTHPKPSDSDLISFDNIRLLNAGMGGGPIVDNADVAAHAPPDPPAVPVENAHAQAHKMEERRKRDADMAKQCVDKNPQCAAWAKQGECTRNSRYMLSTCAKSCDAKCNEWSKEVKDRRDEGDRRRKEDEQRRTGAVARAAEEQRRKLQEQQSGGSVQVGQPHPGVPGRQATADQKKQSQIDRVQQMMKEKQNKAKEAAAQRQKDMRDRQAVREKELEQRRKLDEEAKRKREDDNRVQRAQEEAKRRQQAEAMKKAEQAKADEEAKRRREEEESRKREDEESKQRAEEERKRKEAEETRRREETQRRQEAEMRAKNEAEATRREEEAQRREETEQRRLDAERAADEAKLEQERKKQEEEERVRMEEEAQAQAAMAKEEEARQMEAQAQAQAQAFAETQAAQRKQAEDEAQAAAQANIQAAQRAATQPVATQPVATQPAVGQPAVSGGGCVNAQGDVKCAKWAAKGECSKNAKWMYTNCAKSCDPKCAAAPQATQAAPQATQAAPAAPKPGCVDKQPVAKCAK